jgi:hypothetical protein
VHCVVSEQAGSGWRVVVAAAAAAAAEIHSALALLTSV